MILLKTKKRLKKIIRSSSKSSLIAYFVIRGLIILCMVREIMNGNIEHAFLCLLSLSLLLVPAFLEKTFKIELPSVLEVSIFLFIFSAEILGEINNFYMIFNNFDSILHTINGFLAASVGFSLVYLLNENSASFNLSPLFVTLVAFCFSMTIGVVWEFFEYGMDNVFKLDMQKDEIVDDIYTVKLDPNNSNTVISVNDIARTQLLDKDNKLLVEVDGYLDIGLRDTMKDLLVNFIGATVYSLFGFLYLTNKSKYNVAEKFMVKKQVNV